MDRNVATRIDNEADVSPVDTGQASTDRLRLTMRDRLITRVFEEEFLGLARRHGVDAIYLVGFETNPMRIWNRLGLEYRSSIICDRINRINALSALALTSDERIGASIKTEGMQSVLASVRHDWIRGKVRQREHARLKRQERNSPSKEDILWQQIR